MASFAGFKKYIYKKNICCKFKKNTIFTNSFNYKNYKL